MWKYYNFVLGIGYCKPKYYLSTNEEKICVLRNYSAVSLYS